MIKRVMYYGDAVKGGYFPLKHTHRWQLLTGCIVMAWQKRIR